MKTKLFILLRLDVGPHDRSIGGLDCRHVGGQNKRKSAHIVCIKMEVNSQRRKILLFHTTNMAAMTSRAITLFLKEIAHFTVVCLVTWPWIGCEAGGDLVSIQISLLFICRSCCSYADLFAFTYEKR